MRERQNGTKSLHFRSLLQRGPLRFLMEAHDGLSARIVERAGFDAIWGSSLCISASLGLRDRNEISWTNLLDVAEMINESTSLPILLDADDGHGDFNNARLLVSRASRRGIAGVSIEDKPFPKRNSLLDGSQSLLPVEAFCGKIKACRDACCDDNFVMVARTEALVAGYPVAEALLRAERYAEAGADAVIIHSKAGTAEPIVEFMRQWRGAAPVLVIPTTYPNTPSELFEQIGIAAVIWANHTLRAAVLAMQAVCAKIARQRNIAGLDDEVATVAKIFDIVEQSELDDAEAKYSIRP
jgi:phosphoenolpyruvate phosphomutase